MTLYLTGFAVLVVFVFLLYSLLCDCHMLHYSCYFIPQAVLRAATSEMDELVEKIGQHVNVPVRNVLYHCHIGFIKKIFKQNIRT